MTQEKLTEEQILQRMLDADSIPERVLHLERIGIPIKIRGLVGKEVYNIRERSTVYKGKRGQEVEQIDDEEFNINLIAAATVTPNWGNPKLLDKYQASTSSEVIKRMLLAGELAAIGNQVLDLSGYNIELDDIKN